MKTLLSFISLLTALNFNAQNAQDVNSTYRNPTLAVNAPDPTVIRVADGSFYLYSTEVRRNIPIWRSIDLVEWQFVGSAFAEGARPDWEPKGGIWAPDINLINDKYVLYYSMSVWGGVETCGIGVAVADNPEGPFTDKGALFRSNTIGVKNSIDQFYIEDDGHKYLIWGSFHGIYCVELADDGLSLKPRAEKRLIAGRKTETFDSQGTEGSYVLKRNGWYYLFGSTGSCCEGANSTYRVVVGRSKSLFGPYSDKSGASMFDNRYELVLQGNATFAGPGHNAEIITDDNGDDFLLYHSYLRDEPSKGRVLCMDKLVWKDGWPTVQGLEPSAEASAPLFNNQPTKATPVPLADPFILLYEDNYYAYGTNAKDGIAVYTSNDLKTWTKYPTLALHKDNSYGDKNFWAPEVYHRNGKFYMYYTAEEHICVATADSPLGPFRQHEQKPMIADEKCIDNSLFIDDDGKAYLYFDRFNDGLNIWVAELNDNLTDIKTETMKPCIHVSQQWEEVWPRVNEGSFVIKSEGTYFMTYSANSFESPFYGIGVATAPSPAGPWTKYAHNPIYQNVRELVGIGHSAMFRDKNGALQIVFHSHNSKTKIHPRLMHISSVTFDKGQMSIAPNYFIPKLASK